jgi:hypothetical protein
MSNESIIQHYLSDVLSSFRAHKKLAEKAIEQLKDEEFFVKIDEEANSVAVIMKHIAGNMLSRWTDFLNSDGEKPDRNRDMEFVIEAQTSKDDLMAYWRRGWTALFAALEPLRPEDFEKKITIRGEEHSIIQAINRQMTHYAGHIGQIVFLAKHFRSTEWKSLSIPRNRSADFNRYLSTDENRKSNIEHRLDAVGEFVNETEKKASQ